jgi:hypothetical protein
MKISNATMHWNENVQVPIIRTVKPHWQFSSQIGNRWLNVGESLESATPTLRKRGQQIPLLEVQD